MDNKNLLVKICASKWENASRDYRELMACKKLGLDILVVAKGENKDKGSFDKVGEFEVRRYNTRPLGNHIPNSINRVFSMFTWAKYVRRLRPSIISGHDITGAFIGYLSNFFRRDKSKIIYDSHEFELGRNTKRSALSKFLIKRLERFIIKKSAITMMVNDSIACEVQAVYKLSEKPLVVRNLPRTLDIKDEEVLKAKKDITSHIGEVKLTLMYHGLISNGRGLEDVIKAVSDLKKVGLVVFGNYNSSSYYQSIKEMIDELGQGRIYLHPAGPLEELMKYECAVDVGMVNISPVTKSYYYALPNKLFECIHAEHAVIVSDLPEQRNIVNKYGVGLICEPDDIESLKACINHLIENPEDLHKFNENAKVAKAELCWEKEEKVLINAYSTLLN